MRGCDFMRAKGYFTSNLVHRSRDGRSGLYHEVRAAARTEHPATFHGCPTRAHRSSTQLDLRSAVWGSEEFKTERRARGFSPARSRSKGRRLARVAVAASLSAQWCLMEVCLGGPSGRARGKEASWWPGDAPRPDDWARKAMEASRRRREAGLGFVSSGIQK
jgi:hypothetical protein